MKGDLISDDLDLDFEVKVNCRTGEELLHRKRSAYRKNLVFTITPGNRFVKVAGSLHKYSNDGDCNNDRFTFDRFILVADELSKYISDDDLINVIEFAVNIQVDFNPTDFINNLICHQKTPFNKSIRTGISYSQVEYKHYLIKIYNKGLQQPTGSNILRFEVKYLRMQKLAADGLKWSYLRKIETWMNFGDILRKKFAEVIYYDPSIDLNQVSEKDLQFLKDGRNPFYWSDLSGPHVNRTRKRYQDLIKKYGSRFHNLSELLDQEIKEVVKSYRNSDNDFAMKIMSQNPQLVKSYPLLYGNNSPTLKDRMFCPVTGHDISMQKSGSRFLSIAGIKYLYLHNRELYNKLAAERLSIKWNDFPLKVHFREIAHSIRNQYFNPAHNAKKSLQKISADPVLFDVLPTIADEKRRILTEKFVI